MIPCINPGTNEKLCDDIPAMTPEEVEERVQASKSAQEIWGKTPFVERKRVLQKILDYILENKFEICSASCKDSGKTLLEGYLGEILANSEKIRWTIQNGEKYLKPESRHVPLLMLTKKAEVKWIPKGVVASIIPWNYPFTNIISGTISALFAGNGVVVKPSEIVAWSTIQVFEKIFHECLSECGYSPDLVQFVLGYGDVGSALIKSPGISHVFFIGSPVTGARVMEAASYGLKECTLELGGKDPFIVTEDIDLDFIVDYAIRAIFYNMGQNCIAAERFYVHKKIIKSFTDSVVKETKKLKIGPTICKPGKLSRDEINDCGAITMKHQINIIQSLVDDAIEKGATCLVGGSPILSEQGQYYPPTILTNVTHDMRIVKEETFGPVMLVLEWSDDNSVAELANEHEFGLGSYVFCRDAKRAQNIADQLVAGVTMVNDYGVFYMIQSLPFGGTKKSGFGKFNGSEGLRAFCYQKSCVRDRFPGLLVPAPKFFRYPALPSSHLIVDHAVDMIYKTSWIQRIQALIRFLKEVIQFNKESKKEK